METSRRDVSRGHGRAKKPCPTDIKVRLKPETTETKKRKAGLEFRPAPFYFLLFTFHLQRSSLRFRRHRRNNRLDVPEREREALHVIGIAVNVRNMIRHQHA